MPIRPSHWKQLTLSTFALPTSSAPSSAMSSRRSSVNSLDPLPQSTRRTASGGNCGERSPVQFIVSPGEDDEGSLRLPMTPDFLANDGGGARFTSPAHSRDISPSPMIGSPDSGDRSTYDYFPSTPDRDMPQSPVPVEQKKREKSPELSDTEQDGPNAERNNGDLDVGTYAPLERGAKKRAKITIDHNSRKTELSFVNVFKKEVPQQLQKMRMTRLRDLSLFTQEQKDAGWDKLTQQNTQELWEGWYFPPQQRVSAALFETIYQYCRKNRVDINGSNMEELLDGCFEELREKGDPEISGEQIEEEGEIRPARLSDFFAKELEIQFRAKETESLFSKEMVGNINRLITEKSEKPVEADMIWKLCVNPIAVKSAIDAGVSRDNWLLRYISNAPGEPHLLGMKKCWEYIVGLCKESKPLSADILIKIYETYCEKSSFFTEKNGNKCSLLKGSNLTAVGEEILANNIKKFKKLGIPVGAESFEDEDYGLRGFELGRDHIHPNILKKALEYFVKEHGEKQTEINASKVGEAQEKALQSNDFDLAQKITQGRIFRTGNPIVGHFLLNFLRLRRGKTPASLFNYDALDGFSNAQLLKQFKAHHEITY